MKRERKAFSREFKLKAVRLMEEGKKPPGSSGGSSGDMGSSGDITLNSALLHWFNLIG